MTAKRVIWPLLPVVFLSLIFLNGCLNPGPKSVAKDFFTALEAKDYEKAKTFIAEGNGFAFMALQTAKSFAKVDRAYEIGEEEIDGDQAWVKYQLKGGEGVEQKLNLVKNENGLWKIKLTMTDVADLSAKDNDAGKGWDGIMEAIDEGIDDLNVDFKTHEKDLDSLKIMLDKVELKLEASEGDGDQANVGFEVMVDSAEQKISFMLKSNRITKQEAEEFNKQIEEWKQLDE